MNTATTAIRPEYVEACGGNKDMEMLALGLELSIIAPTNAQHKKCVAIAEAIASRLNLEQVETCKALVQKALDLEEVVH